MFSLIKRGKEKEKALAELRLRCREEVDRGASKKAADVLINAFEKGAIDFQTALDKADDLVYCNDLDELQIRFRVSEPPAEKAKKHGTMDPVYGAIYGDIIGSYFEGHAINSAKMAIDNPYDERFHPTDDSFLTLASLYGVIVTLTDRAMTVDDIAPDRAYPIEDNPYARAYKLMAQAHPDAGYGSRFISWMSEDSSRPYGSLGNGSAMRVSPIGAYYDAPEDVIREAAHTAMATHNHIEGVKGAVVAAMCIWMTKHGYSKDQIFGYMQKHYSYGTRIFDEFTYEEATRRRTNQVECSYSVPAAVIAFRDSTDFKDAIDKAACIGFDTDTNACICGGIAGAYYGITEDIKDVVAKKLEECGEQIG